VSKLIDSGRVEETIYFSADEQSGLTYALVCGSGLRSPDVQFTGGEVVVAVSKQQAITWAESEQVGIYATFDLGPRGTLDLIVEKDFACIDRGEGEELDTFPNPKAK
jgi:hypothetical protein